MQMCTHLHLFCYVSPSVYVVYSVFFLLLYYLIITLMSFWLLKSQRQDGYVFGYEGREGGGILTGGGEGESPCRISCMKYYFQ